MRCVSTVQIMDVNLHINLRLFLLAASVILERIIRTLLDNELLTTQRLEMLITSNLRTLCFSWLEKKRPPIRGKDTMDVMVISDILHRTSLICPVG